MSIILNICCTIVIDFHGMGGVIGANWIVQGHVTPQNLKINQTRGIDLKLKQSICFSWHT